MGEKSTALQWLDADLDEAAAAAALLRPILETVAKAELDKVNDPVVAGAKFLRPKINASQWIENAPIRPCEKEEEEEEEEEEEGPGRSRELTGKAQEKNTAFQWLDADLDEAAAAAALLPPILETVAKAELDEVNDPVV